MKIVDTMTERERIENLMIERYALTAERDCYKAALEEISQTGWNSRSHPVWKANEALEQGKKIRGEK